jgi:hypothetical protein
MPTGRLVKSHEDITMTEVTFSGVNGALGRAYSVRAANDPTSTKQFRDMPAADTYYQELMRRVNPVRSDLIETEISSGPTEKVDSNTRREDSSVKV